MGNVVTHEAWAERVAEWAEQGTFSWEVGDGKIAAAYLLSPEGGRVAAVQLDVVVGLVAALNTVEGRTAYNRASIREGT